MRTVKAAVSGVKAANRRANELAERYQAYVYIFLALGMAISLWQVDKGNDASEERNDKTLGAIIGVQIENCRNDHVFRRQYKTRGEVEQAEGPFLLSLAHEKVAAGDDPTGAAQRFIDRYGPLSERLEIIPLPNCRDSGERLRQSIERSGIKVPPIPKLSARREAAKVVPKYGDPVPAGGDASQPGSTGSQPSGPRGGGAGDVDNGAGRGGENPDREPDRSGSGGPSAPAGGGSDPAPAPPSGGTNREPARPPAAPSAGPVPAAPESRGLIPDTVEAAGKAVEQVGEGAGKAVEGVGETADCVLRGSC